MSHVLKCPFEQWFLDNVDPVWEDARSYPQQVLSLTESGVPNYSAAYVDLQGDPLWAWGVFPYWKGVGEVWMLFDKRATRYSFQIVRRARVMLEFLEETNYGGWGFTRIFGQFDTRLKSNYRLAKLLGFQEEGLLRKYYDGHDFAVYARVH